MFEMFLTRACPVASIPDYVQVLDMGTLELRITAVKPDVNEKPVGEPFPTGLEGSHIFTLSCVCRWFLD